LIRNHLAGRFRAEKSGLGVITSGSYGSFAVTVDLSQVQSRLRWTGTSSGFSLAAGSRVEIRLKVSSIDRARRKVAPPSPSDGGDVSFNRELHHVVWRNPTARVPPTHCAAVMP